MSSTTSLPLAVVADANVIVSALIGGRARLVFASALGPTCIGAPAGAGAGGEPQPGSGGRPRVDPARVDPALAVIPIEWRPATAYLPFRSDAERLIGTRDPDDWPTVALALATSLPIWSQDKDFEATGIEIHTTGELLDAIRARGGAT